jgi:hypothetical protein
MRLVFAIEGVSAPRARIELEFITPGTPLKFWFFGTTEVGPKKPEQRAPPSH